MNINDRIIATVDTIENLLGQSICAADDGKWYEAGRAAAAARDVCEALIVRIDGLVCALSTEGYNYESYSVTLRGLRAMHDRLAVRVRGFETRLAR